MYMCIYTNVESFKIYIRTYLYMYVYVYVQI